MENMDGLCAPNQIGRDAAALIARYLDLGFSCAETTIRVLRDLYGVRTPEALLKMTSTFRGGASVDGRCGIIESALALFSYHLGTDPGRFAPGIGSEVMHMFSVELQTRFRETLESTQCGRLWELNTDAGRIEETECVIRSGGLIAAFVYGKYLNDSYLLHEDADAFIIREIEKQRRDGFGGADEDANADGLEKIDGGVVTKDEKEH
ncbi:MAG: C-GCAxxG-C-C family protein [Clostridiales Family XIII bacterium]|nr:C-GCAxxG-C-C family protein [Clostridiales Family XIII bacterium]